MLGLLIDQSPTLGPRCASPEIALWKNQTVLRVSKCQQVPRQCNRGGFNGESGVWSTVLQGVASPTFFCRRTPACSCSSHAEFIHINCCDWVRECSLVQPCPSDNLAHKSRDLAQCPSTSTRITVRSNMGLDVGGSNPNSPDCIVAVVFRVPNPAQLRSLL